MNKLTKTLALALAVTSLTVPVMAGTIGLNINGTAVKTTVAPYQSNGTTLVPIRVVSENLGATVGWNQKEQKVTIAQGSTTIDLTLGSKTAKVNGKATTLNLAPQIKNNTTMVPIRFVSENLNSVVNWNKDTQVVSVTSKTTVEHIEGGTTTTTSSAITVTPDKLEDVKEDTIIVKNPTIFAGVPSVSVEWLEKNLDVDTTYYKQWNRYSIISSDAKNRLVVSEKSKWVMLNMTIQPYVGDYDCGTNKSNSKISIDLVAKTFGYVWKYDKSSNILEITKLIDKEVIPQKPVEGHLTIKGDLKYLDNLEPVKNVEVKITLRSKSKTTNVNVKTDSEGNYEYKLPMSEVNKYQYETASVKYSTNKGTFGTRKTNFVESNNYDGMYFSIYTPVYDTIYVQR